MTFDKLQKEKEKEKQNFTIEVPAEEESVWISLLFFSWTDCIASIRLASPGYSWGWNFALLAVAVALILGS
ncbi:hypothetical protein V6N12_030794 [Hibiscus sabdariffa]|uniref:Uncharacterized protein n=1 Tax=Hibiscus sabdariffa TaxID=183260 RepID=A0ABR2E723_9ROSI